MGYTDEQLLAIRHDGENILVSAGAGSGKTAVLTQRVLEKLLRGIAVDDLIVLTFTNAAAVEMKTRIKAKILAEPTLHPQLRRLDNAVISTFDSFALRLVKEYHYWLGIGDDLRIVDQAVLGKTQESTLDQIMESRYRKRDPRFLETIDRLFDKGDEGFREAVMTLAKGMEMIPDPLNYLSRYEETFFGTEAIQSRLNAFRSYLARQTASLLRTHRTATAHLVGCLEPKIREWLSTISASFSALSTTKDDDEWLANLSVFQIPPTPRLGKEVQETWGETLKTCAERLRDAVKIVRSPLEKLGIRTVEEGKSAWLETKSCVLEVVSCTRDYLRELNIQKRERNLFDFGDVMQMAIRLLEDHSEIAEGYQRRIDEILVDEYQDTNDLQDHFLSLLEKNNLFLVGDVKQSIYGFRNANPKNFLRIYHDYEDHRSGKNIDLLANFRSRKEVLQGINAFFENLMDETIGGVDYKNRQALLCGNAVYDQRRLPETDYSPQILTYGIPEDEESPVSKPFREGTIIAADIRRKLDSGFRVLDPGLQSLRPAALNDFAILVDRKSGFEDYEKALVGAGLSVLAITDEKFIAASEILFVNNALRLIKCFRDPDFFATDFSTAFFGVARSFAFEIPDEDIIETLTLPGQTSPAFLDDLGKNTVFTRLIRLFQDLASRSEAVPLEDTLTDLVRQTRMFFQLAALPDPDNVERKLLFLIEKAKELPDFTLDDLIDYFDGLYRAKDLDVEFSRPYDPTINAVRLMTMHKSKGLEFPVCYYPGLAKRFNFSESKAFFQFDKQFGLLTKAWDDGFKETILHPLVRERAMKELISERIRLFYVALTRAREQIILLLEEGTGKTIVPQYNQKGYLETDQRLRLASYADFLAAVPECQRWKKPVVLPESETSRPVREPKAAPVPIHYRELSFPVQQREAPSFSKASLALRTPEENAAVALGTRFHAELEHFDFGNVEASMKRVSPYVGKAVSALLHSEALRDLDQAVIHQEYEFRHATASGLRRGIIDLLVEYPERILIIDYKLKSLDDEAYRRQLSGYRDVIRDITGKPVETYLFSILDRLLIPMGGSL